MKQKLVLLFRKYFNLSVFLFYTLLFCILIGLVVNYIGTHTITYYGIYLNDTFTCSAKDLVEPLVGVVMLYLGTLPILASVLRINRPSVPFYEPRHSMGWTVLAICGTLIFVCSLLIALLIFIAMLNECMGGHYFALENATTGDFDVYYNDLDLESTMLVIFGVIPSIYAFVRSKYIYSVIKVNE